MSTRLDSFDKALQRMELPPPEPNETQKLNAELREQHPGLPADALSFQIVRLTDPTLPEHQRNAMSKFEVFAAWSPTTLRVAVAAADYNRELVDKIMAHHADYQEDFSLQVAHSQEEAHKEFHAQRARMHEAANSKVPLSEHRFRGCSEICAEYLQKAQIYGARAEKHREQAREAAKPLLRAGIESVADALCTTEAADRSQAEVWGLQYKPSALFAALANLLVSLANGDPLKASSPKGILIALGVSGIE